MEHLHYIKASDVEFDYCFLEVSLDSSTPAFMDIRITDDQEINFCFYASGPDTFLSSQQWLEIHQNALAFLKSEIENFEANARADRT